MVSWRLLGLDGTKLYRDDPYYYKRNNIQSFFSCCEFTTYVERGERDGVGPGVGQPLRLFVHVCVQF